MIAEKVIAAIEAGSGPVQAEIPGIEKALDQLNCSEFAMKFEEEYMDVLQNIEFGIVSVYRKYSELTDYDTLNAIEALIRYYTAEEQHKDPPSTRLSDRAQLVFYSVKEMCDMRLGRQSLDIKQSESFISKIFKLKFFKSKTKPKIEPKTLSEIIACLKRLRTSIRSWNKRGGRQGYLKFSSQFIP